MSSPVSEPQGEPSGLRDEESLSVLLVEDNPGDARLFEEYLTESPVEAEVRHEKTLRACLNALGETRPDVLVVDLGLPDSEGAETVKAAAAAAPEVPIVVLTGDGNLQAALQAQEAGAAEYLQKEELTPALAGRTLRWALRQSRMQEKLRQRDAWIRSITESISAGVFRVGPTGRIEYANEALAEMLGFGSEEELIGRDLTRFYADPADRGKMLAEEGADGTEVKLEGKGGEELVGLLSAKPAYDQDGIPLHYDGTVTDITQRVEAKRKLRRSRDRLARHARMLDEIGQAVIATDERGTVTFWNAAAEGTYGWTEDEALGRDIMELTVPESAREEADGIMAAIQEQESSTREFEVRRKDGSTFPAIVSNTPLSDEEGELTGVIGVTTDITDRKQREERLRMLSEALEQAKESVLITEAEPLDEPGPRIEYVNAACEEMTGWSEEEILGKTPRVLQGPETEREVLDSLRDALEAGEEWQGETINYRKGGEPYRVQWNVAPVESDSGEIEHWVSVQRDVTEEREREKRLTQMAQALDQVGDKVVITDRDGQIQYVNEAFEDVTGYSEEEVLGRDPSVLRSGEQSEDFYEELWATITSGETFRAEFVNEKKDGTRYVEDERISPVRTEEGSITHFVASGRDVTERKEREEELRRQKSLLEQTQRLAGAWEVDLRTGKTSWSDRVYEIHEVEQGTQVGVEEAIEFYAPEAQPRIRRAFQACIQKGKPYDLELPFITAKGNRRWVRTVGAPTKTENGEVVKVAGAFQDITDRKEAEQELRRSQERLRMATEAGNIGVWDWDLETGEVIFNRQWAEMLGYSREELDFHFSTWEKLVHPEDLPRAMELLEEYIEGKRETYAPEIRMRAKSGDWKWIQTIGKVINRDEEGEVTRAAGVHLNIDQRKRREQDLVEAKEEAERMNRLKSAFLANMSHEIRTPLTSILGFAEAIGEEARGAASAEEVDLSLLTRFSALIEKSGRRLMETLTGVLDLSKLEAGEMDLSAQPVDLATEAREAAEEFMPRAEEAGIDLQVEGEEAPVWARADEGGVQIALRNLISNAIKYTGEGGAVWVRAKQEEEATVVLEVEDTGIGMDPEKTSELFEPFKQASEGIAREYEGTGLGLALVQRVTDEMGGAVEVETEKGVGSCFTVRLPRAEEAGDESSA